MNNEWRTGILRSQHIEDHLIAAFHKGKARIRICAGTATLTLKGNRKGISRSEFHVPLSFADAALMVREFGSGWPLKKTRHDVEFSGLLWQVDEFAGALSGLVTVDVELPAEDYSLILPSWAGPDITADARFRSRTLVSALKQGEKAIAMVMAASTAVAMHSKCHTRRSFQHGQAP